jgi:ABC-type transport system substrate-binding protein
MVLARAVVLTLTLLAALPAQADRARPKTLHVAFPIAETGFDPAQVSDNYSITICSHIFESLYGYDHLARPVKIKPVTAAGMPEVSADFRTWTVRIRPGILFADDPVFKGKPRELTAQDYVYSYKRFADPANKSPLWTSIEKAGFMGMAALRRQALGGKAFDYEREIAGMRALDRYTIQFKLDAPRPRLLDTLAINWFGAVAREVVTAYGDRIVEHPVGTGPFRLAQWRRSSQIVLERNPVFREMYYDAEPADDDTEGQAILAQLKGRRLPMVDRVEISIVSEEQPRWLAFLDGSIDSIDLPTDFLRLSMPNGKVAPNLARRGIRGYRELTQTVSYTFFNMDDPVVGGYTPEKVALRRAIGLAMNVERQIQLVRGGQAVVAQSPVPAQTSAFDPAFRSENGEYSPARAKALLDLFGYVDRNGDGWREMPDGAPLVLEFASEPDQRSRRFDELMKHDMDAVGIRSVVKVAPWPEQAKAARAGKLMIWTLGYGVTSPDSAEIFDWYASSGIGGFNFARFKLPAMESIIDRLQALPDGAERSALINEAKRIAIAYMPYKVTVHRVESYMAQPWLIGYRPTVFWSNWYHMVDIDESRRAAH